MPRDLPLLSHEEILRYEEILRVCAVAVKTGVRAFKVTGGEPLARRGCVDFIRRLAALPGAERVTVTTNGVLLEPLAGELRETGLAGLNLSLDSLEAATYRAITGFDGLSRVLRALKAAVEAGLPVKINCVPLRGVNDGEIEAIAGLAARRPVDVRFIELMPTGAGKRFGRVPADEVVARLAAAFPGLAPDDTKRGNGPARYFSAPGLRGALGVIDAIGGCFCAGCNRVRLTGEGFLKPCLYHGGGVSLRELLRDGAGDGALEAAFRQAIAGKPERHCFGGGDENGGIRQMSRIGG